VAGGSTSEPSTTTDITSFATTVTSTVSETSTIMGVSKVVTVMGACLKMSGRVFNINNCLRAMLNRRAGRRFLRSVYGRRARGSSYACCVRDALFFETEFGM
jgi:hypothetical protein